MKLNIKDDINMILSTMYYCSCAKSLLIAIILITIARSCLVLRKSNLTLYLIKNLRQAKCHAIPTGKATNSGKDMVIKRIDVKTQGMRE